MIDMETVLKEMEIPYTYHHFEEEEVQDAPFICWFYSNTSNIFADGKLLEQISELDIQLYTDDKDIEMERKLERILEKYEINWNKEETFIESEQYYEVDYNTEVIIDAK